MAQHPWKLTELKRVVKEKARTRRAKVSLVVNGSMHGPMLEAVDVDDKTKARAKESPKERTKERKVETKERARKEVEETK